MMRSNIHIGTSGWNYNHWKETFYPKSLSQAKWFAFYSERFETVEINNSFYQLPERKTFQTWLDQSPETFIYSVKASRYITHMKKLKDPGEALTNFLDRVDILDGKLGPILFQLPPRWRFNFERLDSFLALLPKQYRYTFEFRDSSWWNDSTYEALSKHNAAFCIFDLERTLSPKEVTADFIYIRLHGPEDAYQGKYDEKTLSEWSKDFELWQKQNKEIFCYFDNDQFGYAAQNALELQSMVHI